MQISVELHDKYADTKIDNEAVRTQDTNCNTTGLVKNLILCILSKLKCESESHHK